MTKSNFFFSFLTLLFLSTTSISAESIAKDSLNLIEFNRALNGGDWKVKWDFKQPVSKWYGVRTSKGRVTHLTLFGNNLKGKIPAELGYLTGLISLNLGNNHFEGNFPSTIEHLDKLERMFVQNSELSGPLPAEIGLLDNLAYLGLKENRISGDLPETLGLLPKLVSVYLDDNQLTGTVPASMATMDSLRTISLKNNNINEVLSSQFVEARLGNFNLIGNSLTFEDLLPLKAIASQLNRCGHKTLSYDEQAILELPAFLELYPKQSSIISIPELTSVSGNVFNWFKDGEFLETRYSNDFAIVKMDAFKEGVYSCEISNPSIPDLILNTTDIKVTKKKWNGEDFNDQITVSSGLNIFPNPTDGAFSYSFNHKNSGKFTVTVTDVLGQVFFTEEINKADSSFKGNITIDGLASGIYLLTVKNDASKFSGKLTIIPRD